MFLIHCVKKFCLSKNRYWEFKTRRTHYWDEKLADDSVYTVTEIGFFSFSIPAWLSKSICFGIPHLDLHIGCPLLSPVLWTYYCLISLASDSSSTKWRYYMKIDNMNIKHSAQDLAQSKRSTRGSLSFVITGIRHIQLTCLFLWIQWAFQKQATFWVSVGSMCGPADSAAAKYPHGGDPHPTVLPSWASHQTECHLLHRASEYQPCSSPAGPPTSLHRSNPDTACKVEGPLCLHSPVEVGCCIEFSFSF